MADLTETELAQQAEQERLDRERAEAVVDDPEPESTGVARLRAFEDEHFGKDAVRINGRVERGSGSRYQALPEPKRRHYQALEKLVEADEKLVAAHTALMTADAAHEAAMEAVALAEKEADAVAEQ